MGEGSMLFLELFTRGPGSHPVGIFHRGSGSGNLQRIEPSGFGLLGPDGYYRMALHRVGNDDPDG